MQPVTVPWPFGPVLAAPPSRRSGTRSTGGGRPAAGRPSRRLGRTTTASTPERRPTRCATRARPLKHRQPLLASLNRYLFHSTVTSFTQPLPISLNRY